MLRLGLFSVALFATSVAHGKEVTFFFDVHSSGPEIYPCDAGMIQIPGNHFCHFKGSATECTPAQVGQTVADIGGVQLTSVEGGTPLPPSDPAHACICTGSEGGDYLMNFLRYKAAIWGPSSSPGDNPNHIGWGPTTTGVIQGTAAGVTVARAVRSANGITPAKAKNVRQELATQLESVVFNFGTEVYGAQFFVDLCYRGPQLPYYADGVNDAKALFATKAYVTATNPFTTGSRSTLNYVDMADLAMSWDIACDRQGEGDYKYDHNGSSLNDPDAEFDTTDTDLRDKGVRSLPGGYTTPPEAGTYWVGNLDTKDEGSVGMPKYVYGGILESLGHLSQHWIIGTGGTGGITDGGFDRTTYITTPDSSHTPRFCKLRYYFAERPFTDRERAWQRADARFIVKWAVEELE